MFTNPQTNCRIESKHEHKNKTNITQVSTEYTVLTHIGVYGYNQNEYSLSPIQISHLLNCLQYQLIKHRIQTV